MVSTLYVNLFGGPGTGKSTTAAGVFSILKAQGVNAEYVTEYAKRKVWEQSYNVLHDQVYILGKQYHAQWCLKDQVDVVITDSPLFLSLVYGSAEGPEFVEFVKHLHGRFRNLDVFLRRVKPFNPAGRTQSEDKAVQLDVTVKNMLLKHSPGFLSMDANPKTPSAIVDLIHQTLREPREIPSIQARLDARS